MKNRNNLPIDQVDVKELLDSLGIRYTERGKNVSNDWIGVSCPFCGDNSNHLGINIHSKLVSCFKCGKKGSVLHYLSEYLYSYQKALKLVESAIPRELRSFITEKTNSTVERVSLPDNCTREILPAHAKYLISRKYKPEKLYKKYNLYSVGPVGEWKNRIIVPIYRFGKLVTFTSIDVSVESELRYKHLSEEKSIMHCKQLLYGEEFTNRRKVIVVEGHFDKYRFGDGTVNTFGTKVTAEQKILLSRYEEVAICFDGDEDGIKSGTELAEDLSAFTVVNIYYLPEGLDPDKLNKKQIKLVKGEVK